MTETLMTLSNPYDGERRAGTVGFPFPGVEAWVGDEPRRRRAGTAGAPGERGRRRDPGAGAHACSAATGSARRPPPSASTRRAGSAPATSASVDADGYVAVRGRLTELVISGGYNVYPAEVEDVLLGHPGGGRGGRDRHAVGGVGRGGDRLGGGRRPAAPDVEALLAYAAERLAPYKRPRRGPLRRLPAAQRPGQGPRAPSCG